MLGIITAIWLRLVSTLLVVWTHPRAILLAIVIGIMAAAIVMVLVDNWKEDDET